MNGSLLTILAAGMLTVFTPAAAAGNSATYSNLDDNKITWWGTSKSESYDIAAKIDSPEFCGLQISEISFRVADDEKITGHRIWLTTTLSLEGKQNVADLLSEETQPIDGMLTLSLAEPITIPAEGLYIGYSFNLEANDNSTLKKPVAIVKGADAAGHGMWLHSSRTYQKWTDYASSSNSWVPFELTLTNLKRNSVAITLPEEINGGEGKPVRVNALLTNHGFCEASDFSVTYKAGNYEGECEVVCEGFQPGVFNATCAATLTLPAFEETLNSDIELSVAKINGLTNEDESSSATSFLNIWSRLPRRTPLFEEYTGTGCGYCPRGNIGIEKLSEMFGERFVAVAYHCSDIMSIFRETEDFPNYAPAQPVAWIDRVLETDPYFGDNTTGEFHADAMWQQMADRFTPADIELTCRWADDAEESIVADATVSFVKPFEEADFRMVYILTADGLRGEGTDWKQGNYYSGEEGKWPEEFGYLVSSERYMDNMTYDHVAIYSTPVSGIEGSIPSTIVADQSFSHTATLDLKDAVNVKGMSLVQDKSRIRVVAALVDAKSGEVVNCASASAGNSAVGSIENDTEIKSVQCYNLLGQPVSPGYKGVKVTVTTLSSGKQIVKKSL